MTLRCYESAFLKHFKLCLTPLNHQALQRVMHVRIWPILQHEMPLISYIKGDHLIIPGALDQGATAEHRPMLFLLDERVDGRDPSPLPAVCPRLLCAGTPLGDYTVPPRSKSQYWNNHKDKHLPLKQARVLPPQALLCTPQFFGGGCLNLYSSQYLSCLNQQEGRKFVLWVEVQKSFLFVIFFHLHTL